MYWINLWIHNHHTTNTARMWCNEDDIRKATILLVVFIR